MRKRLTIEDMQVIAGLRGGKCLSEVYYNIDTKLLWECADGHQWETIPYLVKNGSWCPVCAGNTSQTIEDMKEISSKRGGKCLSLSYVNNKTNLLWECAEGHQWEATPSNVSRGQWCPKCSSGFGERVCREFFEQKFGINFPKSYPAWLFNSRGNQMELDGYCESLGLAFEHHGIQHYKQVDFFHKSVEDFRLRQTDDEMRRRLCIENGVHLLEIPEIPTQIMIEELEPFIINECNKCGFALSKDFFSKKVDFNKAYAVELSREVLKFYKSVAKEREGKCLSSEYSNSSTKLLWKCDKGHKWEAIPSTVRHGAWCPHCAGNAKNTMESLVGFAKEKRGECLSNEYKGAHKKLLWACEKGHKWEATAGHVVNGTWCPECKGSKKKTIDDMRTLATQQKGKCLSSEYKGVHTKLLWECAEGHQWEATPGNISRGRWCPTCSHKMQGAQRRQTIDDMRLIAEERNGKCTSSIYIGCKDKLLWECEKGHQWEAIPSSVKRGAWCPFCAGTRKGTIDDMVKLARKHGGECLSAVYINNLTALEWRCSCGFQWDATPKRVKSGQWCPSCKK